jgi:hypothetical protein
MFTKNSNSFSRNSQYLLKNCLHKFKNIFNAYSSATRILLIQYTIENVLINKGIQNGTY